MAADGEIKVHEATYNKVIGVLKWGAIGCFLIAMLVIWLIHPTK
ncbi:MAG: aa3-type cytochrome c oxidase subunit IV [Sphingomonas sp.]